MSKDTPDSGSAPTIKNETAQAFNFLIDQYLLQASLKEKVALPQPQDSKSKGFLENLFAYFTRPAALTIDSALEIIANDTSSNLGLLRELKSALTEKINYIKTQPIEEERWAYSPTAEPERHLNQLSQTIQKISSQNAELDQDLLWARDKRPRDVPTGSRVPDSTPQSKGNTNSQSRS